MKAHKPDEQRIAEVATQPYLTTPINIEPGARVMLAGSLLPLNELLQIVEDEARASRLTIQRVEVMAFNDPEEDSEYVIVAPWLESSADKALDYWDRLGDAIDVWMDGLPKGLANAIEDKFVIEVEWNQDDAV